ncbi:hypothetical protein GCM10023201_40910 [Actinomycetospora corticicola]|uniref:Uncharacterized protein n=1 Tax=Actinomycetospora corticicola TaxID=663602 RepID=A0A7Y9DWP2_9PSEU|nr:hypothetical protein [Actinomycetospora corticicola]NYD36825.1 hypothetical protein [Actinomycetospora corticicola]
MSALTDPAPSLFEQLMAEAVDPLLVELDDDNAVQVDGPSADAVSDLDHLLGVEDVTAWVEDVSGELAGLLARRPWTVTLDAVAGIRGHFALVDLPPGMWTVLVEQVDLYGEAIETDLFDRGSDLLDWFRGRRPWPQLLRLMQRLPPESHYKAALLDDEELAEERIAAEQADGERRSSKSKPPLVGETQERALLRSIAGALPRIEHAVYAVNAPKGKAGRPPTGLPSPETAEDRVRSRLGDADVEDLIAAATPWDAAARRAPAGYAESDSGLLVPDH